MVARLSCILMPTGVSSYWVVWQGFSKRYTRGLLEASPEFPIHFLKIYSAFASAINRRNMDSNKVHSPATVLSASARPSMRIMRPLLA
jgi:hypothetical protein